MSSLSERIEDTKRRIKEHAIGTLTTEQVMRLQHDIDDLVRDISPNLRQDLVDCIDEWYQIHRLRRWLEEGRYRDRRSEVSGRP